MKWKSQDWQIPRHCSRFMIGSDAVAAEPLLGHLRHPGTAMDTCMHAARLYKNHLYIYEQSAVSRLHGYLL